MYVFIFLSSMMTNKSEQQTEPWMKTLDRDTSMEVITPYVLQESTLDDEREPFWNLTFIADKNYLIWQIWNVRCQDSNSIILDQSSQLLITFSTCPYVVDYLLYMFSWMFPCRVGSWKASQTSFKVPKKNCMKPTYGWITFVMVLF